MKKLLLLFMCAFTLMANAQQSDFQITVGPPSSAGIPGYYFPGTVVECWIDNLPDGYTIAWSSGSENTVTYLHATGNKAYFGIRKVGIAIFKATVYSPSRPYYIENHFDLKPANSPTLTILPPQAGFPEYIPGLVAGCKLENLPENSTVTWSSGNEDVTTFLRTENNIGYFGIRRNGLAIFRATVYMNGIPIELEESLQIGPVTPQIIVGAPSEGNMGHYVPGTVTICRIENLPENSTVYWSGEGSATYVRTENQNGYFGFNSVGTATFKATVIANGNTYNLTESVEVSYPSYNSSASSTESIPTAINIYSFPAGAKVHTTKKPIEFNIESTHLKKGIYIIETIDSNGQVTREKVAKTH